MTNTVTLLADHKGFTTPKVLGDEYVSLGSVAISSYRTGSPDTGASQGIAADSSGKTFTNLAGTFVTNGFVVGDHVVVANLGANSNAVFKLSAVTQTVLTTTQSVSTVSATNDERVQHAGEKILASSFGLNSISSIELVGQSNHDCNYIIGDISSDGTFFYLYAYTTGSAGLLSASLQSGDLGTVKLKVTGNL